MRQKRGFLHVYLYLTLAFGILSFVDNALTAFNVANNIYVGIITLISVLFFFFNLIAIAIFHHHHVERLAFLFPIYHIVSFILFFGVGLGLALAHLIVSWVWVVLLVIGILTSLFEIWFSFYLLRHLGFLGKLEPSFRTRSWHPPEF